MSVAIERPTASSVTPRSKRKPWTAWRVSEDSIRVQLNEPGLAKAFANVRGAERAGYSVLGPFTEIYSLNRPVTWVHDWMRRHNNGAQAKTSARLDVREN